MDKESWWRSMGVYKAWESRHGSFIDPPALSFFVFQLRRWGLAGWVTLLHERRSMPDKAVCEPLYWRHQSGIRVGKDGIGGKEQESASRDKTEGLIR